MKARALAVCIALGLSAYELRAVAADGAVSAGLQSPEQRDRRGSAYSLPGGMWGLDVSALGLSGGDAFAKVGVAYGFGAGFDLELNLAHFGIGLLNATTNWHFVTSRYLDLGFRLGFWYGHGDWFWILNGLAKRIASELDVVSVPIAAFASVPASRRFAFDLGIQYTWGEVYGDVTGTSIYRKAQLGVRQFELRPSVRFFLSDRVELHASSQLPLYTGVPRERSAVRAEEGSDFDTVPFSEVWSLEIGVRSRFATGIFGTMSLHYSEVARSLFGATLSPAFDVEFRF